MASHDHDDIKANLKSDILQEQRNLLTDNLVPERHMDFLRSKYILSEDDCEEINALMTRKRRASKFLDILCRKGPEAYDMLCRSLELERTQLFILRVLNQEYERRIRNYNEMFMTRPSAAPGLDFPPPNIQPPVRRLEPVPHEDLQSTHSFVSLNLPGHSSVPGYSLPDTYDRNGLSSVEAQKGSIYTQEMGEGDDSNKRKESEMGEGDDSNKRKESDSEFLSVRELLNSISEENSTFVSATTCSQPNPRMSCRGPSIENPDDSQDEEIFSGKLCASACKNSKCSCEHDETEVKVCCLEKGRPSLGDTGVAEDEPDEDEHEFFESLPQSYIENPRFEASTSTTAIPEIISESLPSWKQGQSEMESGSQRDSGFSSRSSQEVSSSVEGYISSGGGSRNATVCAGEESVPSVVGGGQLSDDNTLNLIPQLHSESTSDTENKDCSQC